MWTYLFVFNCQYGLSQAICSITNKNLSLHGLILKYNQFSYLIQENKHMLLEQKKKKEKCMKIGGKISWWLV